MSIISAVILCNKSGISLDSMVSIVTWLRDWMKMKNFNLGELYECNIKKIVKSNIDLYDKVFFLLDEDED